MKIYHNITFLSMLLFEISVNAQESQEEIAVESEDQLEDLSVQLANPLADLMSFPFQNNLNIDQGEFNRNVEKPMPLTTCSQS